jgi:hypothetical protein
LRQGPLQQLLLVLLVLLLLVLRPSFDFRASAKHYRWLQQ